MPRAKKDGRFLNFYVRRDICNKLDRYSEKTMIPKTSLIERALEEYFKNHPLKNSK